MWAGRVWHNRVGAGKSANAGHVESGLVIQQPQLHILLLPGKVPVGYGLRGGAASVAAVGQVAGGAARHHTAAAVHQHARAAQMVAQHVKQPVLPAHRVATHQQGHRLPGKAVGAALYRVRPVHRLLIPREREVGGNAARLHRLGPYAIRVVGKGGGAAAAGRHARQPVLHVKHLGIRASQVGTASHVAVGVVAKTLAASDGCDRVDVGGTAIGIGAVGATGHVAQLVVGVGLAVVGHAAGGAGGQQPVQVVVGVGLAVGSGGTQGGELANVAHLVVLVGEVGEGVARPGRAVLDRFQPVAAVARAAASHIGQRVVGVGDVRCIATLIQDDHLPPSIVGHIPHQHVGTCL